MPNYPYSHAIANPGAETGDNTGWTGVIGSLTTLPAAVASPGGLAPHSGSYAFTGGSASLAWWGQTITVDAGLLADIDAGALELTASVYHAGYSGDADSAALCVECFDGASNWLAGLFAEQSDPADWTQRIAYPACAAEHALGAAEHSCQAEQRQRAFGLSRRF